MQRGQVLSQQLEDKIRNLRPVPSLPGVTPATKRQEVSGILTKVSAVLKQSLAASAKSGQNAFRSQEQIYQ